MLVVYPRTRFRNASIQAVADFGNGVKPCAPPPGQQRGEVPRHYRAAPRSAVMDEAARDFVFGIETHNPQVCPVGASQPLRMAVRRSRSCAIG
jgi:hypothetical protein